MKTSKKILLLANGLVGWRVCDYLTNISKDEIVGLGLVNEDQCRDQIIKASKIDDSKIFSSEILKDESYINKLSGLEFDFIITVYWPYLLTPAVYNLAKQGSINFHPAYLPINRGWYPHVHSIIDGSVAGVTLHVIEEDADAGPIWAQKRVEIKPIDTAKTIYDRLQSEITELFIQIWPKIKDGSIKPIPQDESKAVYHKKSEVDQLNELDINKNYKLRDVINLLRARSFGDKSFAYYLEDGKKIFLNLRLGESDDCSYKND